MITYGSRADGNYISEANKKKVGIPILRRSTKHVRIANGSTSSIKFVTKLLFLQLSEQAADTDIFQEFPTSLMRVGKTADDGNISIFTKYGVIVYKEQDVVIICKGAPILIEKRDERGCYCIFH